MSQPRQNFDLLEVVTPHFLLHTFLRSSTAVVHLQRREKYRERVRGKACVVTGLQGEGVVHQASQCSNAQGNRSRQAGGGPVGALLFFTGGGSFPAELFSSRFPVWSESGAQASGPCRPSCHKARDTHSKEEGA